MLVGTMADLLNEVVQKEDLAIQPVEKPNIFLCIIFLIGLGCKFSGNTTAWQRQVRPCCSVSLL